MSVDTDTRLPRPADLIAEAFAGLAASAALPPEGPTLEVEDARPLHRHAVRPGRHRAPEQPLPGERSTGPISRVPIEAPRAEKSLVGEAATQLIPPVRPLVAVPLPQRSPGATVGDAVPAPSRRLRVFALFLRGLVGGRR